MTVAAILLAGGESSRMGQPKALLPWGPSTGSGQAQKLVEYQIDQLRQPPVERVVVVLGHDAERIRPVIDRAGAEVLVNELYKRGRASSLRAGARAVADDTRTILVLDVDQPRPRRVIQRLIENHVRASNVITVPTCEGKRGHPTVVDGWLLPELRRVRERTEGLRGFLDQHEADVVELPFDSEVVLVGINTPQEYEAAKAKYFAEEEAGGFEHSTQIRRGGHEPGID
jgi:molybdenum cofactor cytidylyltransferase